MKLSQRFGYLVTLVLALTAACTGREASTQITRDATPTKRGVVSYTVTAPGYQKGANSIEVLLPEVLREGERLPVLIILPVNTGRDGNWGSPIEEVRRHNLHNVHRVICVVPSFDVEPWFGDMVTPPADGAPMIRQQAYVKEVVLPLVEREFPALGTRKGRYLIGFSKSGFGALGLLLRNSDDFEAAAVFDCADPNLKGDVFTEWSMVDSFGSRENYDKEFHLPSLIARHAVHFRDSRRIALISGSDTYEGVNNVRRSLLMHDLAHSYHVYPGMAHTWKEGWLPVAFAAIVTAPASADH